MADKQSLAKQIGLTPGRIALVGLLSVTLAVVLYVQFGPGGGASEGPAVVDVARDRPNPAPAVLAVEAGRTPAARAPSTQPAPAKEVARFASTEPAVRVAWKVPDLSEIVAYDPFALPPGFPPSANLSDKLADDEAMDEEKRASELADAVAKLRIELEALRQRGVHVIVRRGDSYVAMIGDRTVHVGDEINGFTVTAIEADGVRVERKVQQ